MSEFLYVSRDDLNLFKHFEKTEFHKYRETQEKISTLCDCLKVLLLVPFYITFIAVIYLFSWWGCLLLLFLPYIDKTLTRDMIQPLSSAIFNKMPKSHTWFQMRLLYEKIVNENGLKSDGIRFEDISTSPWSGARYVLLVRWGYL